jgi:hypothetical protein
MLASAGYSERLCNGFGHVELASAGYTLPVPQLIVMATTLPQLWAWTFFRAAEVTYHAGMVSVCSASLSVKRPS